MPNGGSDCCGTCWFNSKNGGHAGYGHSSTPGPGFCTIRSFAIESPFYTYCANHPHRRPDRDSIPIGPVFTGDSAGAREVSRPSPDTEEIRRHLLDLLAPLREQPALEYPIGARVDEIVIWQLGEFREARAIPDLRRAAAFHPASAGQGPFGGNRQHLALLAREALSKMERILKQHKFECRICFTGMDESAIRRALERALPHVSWEEGDSEWDKIRVSGESGGTGIRVFRYEEPGPFQLTIRLELPEGANSEQAYLNLRAEVLRALNATVC